MSRNGSYWNGSFIGEGQGGVLLSDGDEIRISPRITLVFRTDIRDNTEDIDSIQEAEKNVCPNYYYLQFKATKANAKQYFRQEYRITSRKLGLGAHGSVNMAVKKSTGRQLACKIVDFRKIRTQEAMKFEKLNETRNREKDGPQTPQASANMLSDSQRYAVEEHARKIAREVELLKELSHVSYPI